MRTFPERAEPDTTRSAECALARRPAYEDLHTRCRQTRDVPLPYARGLLLVPRCGCPCHRPEGDEA